MFDRIDIGILRALQNDGRISNKELAAEVGLAPSSCLERVRRLRERGVIRGFRARLDPKALGVGLEALIAVRLTQHTGAVFKEFQAALIARAEVVRVFYTSGLDDFLVHVAVRDTEHLRDLIQETFSDRYGVSRVHTSLIFEHHEAAIWPNYMEGDDE